MAPRTLIIDTDPGVDDVLAILLALASPEVDVKLISIVFGNTHAPVAHANLLKIYHQLANEVGTIPTAAARYGGYGDGRTKDQGRTVLAMGGDDPIGGDKAVAAYFHGKDGLSNLSETHPNFTPPELGPDEVHEHLDLDKRPSWEVMLEMLEKEEEGSVTIVALGPLTNIAHALRANPKVFARIGGLVWMGGTLDRPGNTSPVAEFNCFADPYAADEVLAAVKQGLFPIVMAPLDITTPHDVPFFDLIHPSIIEAAAGGKSSANGVSKSSSDPTPLESFIGNMLLRVRGLQASFGLPDAMEMHDPVAVWYAVCHSLVPAIGTSTAGPAEGFVLAQRDFKIERTGELTRGMCVVDRRGTGESGDNDRTKGELGKGGAVPSLETTEKQDDGRPQKDETTGRMGEKIEKPKKLPYIITQTPGKEELRKTLLSRVFGRED